MKKSLVLLCAVALTAHADTVTNLVVEGGLQQAGAIAGGNNAVALGTNTIAEGAHSFAGGFNTWVRAGDSNSFIFGTGSPEALRQTVHPDTAFFERLHLFSAPNEDPRSVLTREENDARYDARYIAIASGVADVASLLSSGYFLSLSGGTMAGSIDMGGHGIFNAGSLSAWGQISGDGSGLWNLDASKLVNLGSGLTISTGQLAVSGNFGGQAVSNVTTIYVQDRVVTANLDVQDTVTVTRTLTVLAPPTIVSNATGGLTGSLLDGLLAFWPLNEAAGSVASDVSGNGRHGTIGGGVSYQQSFGSSLGMAFDGSSGQIVCPAVIPAGSAAKTVAAWIQPASTTALGVPVGLASFNGCDSNFRFLLAPSQNQLYADIGCSFVLHNTTLTGPHHLVATYSGTTLEFFLDGQSVGTKTQPANTTSSPLLIGNDSGNLRFQGTIAHVGVWNRVLTQAEIDTLHASGGGVTTLYTNVLLQASGTNVTLQGRTKIKEAEIETLVPQGDLSMGSFTNKP